MMEEAHQPPGEVSVRQARQSCSPHHQAGDFYGPEGRPASFWVTSKEGTHKYWRVYPQPILKQEEKVLGSSWVHFFAEVFYYPQRDVFPTITHCLELSSLPFYIQCSFLFPAR